MFSYGRNVQNKLCVCFDPPSHLFLSFEFAEAPCSLCISVSEAAIQNS